MMMNIKKQQLIYALEKVKPGLANKEVIEQATSFAFIEDKVVTYNDEISISHPVDGLNLSGAIKAEELYKLLNKTKKDDIELEQTKTQIVLKCGRMTAKFTLEQEIKLPLQNVVIPKKWKKLPDEFLTYFKMAAASCSKLASQAIITCVHVNENGTIEGTDNFKIIKCEFEPFDFETFLIPADNVAEVIKLKPTKIATKKDTGWVHFKTDEETIISCRIYSEEYPDTSMFFNAEGIEITFPKALIGIIERATIFAKREVTTDEEICITIGKNQIKVIAETDGSTAKFEEAANIKYNDEPIEFTIIPYLLKDILEQSFVCTICEDRLVFSSDAWTYVTALKKPTI